MALTDSDLSELLAALKAGEMTDTIRTSLEWILQQLIEAEATAVIGAAPHERTRPARPSATGTAPSSSPPRRVTSSWRSRSCAAGASSRACWSGAGGSTVPCTPW